jgi:hypothetical protein
VGAETWGGGPHPRSIFSGCLEGGGAGEDGRSSGQTGGGGGGEQQRRRRSALGALPSSSAMYCQSTALNSAKHGFWRRCGRHELERWRDGKRCVRLESGRERWGIDVGMGNGMEMNEISNGRASVSCNLNVSEDSNGAGINDNGLTFGLGVLDLG